MVEVAAGPSDSATHEKVSFAHHHVHSSPPPLDPRPPFFCLFQLPMVLKVPRLNSSPLALCDRPFSLLGFGDILVPGNRWIPSQHPLNTVFTAANFQYTTHEVRDV